jgi:hypothetical protein
MSLLGNCGLGSLWRGRGAAYSYPPCPPPYYYLGYVGAFQSPYMPPSPPPPAPPAPAPQPWFWPQPPAAYGPPPAPPPPTPLVVLPKELQADPTTATADALIGGSIKVQAYVEYISAGGSGTPDVKVTTTVLGVASTWEDSAISEGYHVKCDLALLPPGSKLHIEATNAVLRVRWVEISGPLSQL